MSKVCGNCGVEITTHVNYCPNCGQPLAPHLNNPQLEQWRQNEIKRLERSSLIYYVLAGFFGGLTIIIWFVL